MSVSEVKPADILASLSGCSSLESKIEGLVREHVYPLITLSRRYTEMFEGADESSYYVERLGLLAEEVARRTGLRLNDSRDSITVPGNLVELGRLILEHAANLFPGIGRYGDVTFLAYSLRTIPYIYARSLYPQLHENSRLHRCIHDILGWCTILPLDKMPEYSLMGYPDYPRYLKLVEQSEDKRVFEYKVDFSSCLGECPEKDEKYGDGKTGQTLGGALSRLINASIAVLTRPGYLKTYNIEPDLILEYIEHFRRKELHPYHSGYISRIL